MLREKSNGAFWVEVAMWAKTQSRKCSVILELHSLVTEKDENLPLYCTSHSILSTSHYFQGIRKHTEKYIYLKVKSQTVLPLKNLWYISVWRFTVWKMFSSWSLSHAHYNFKRTLHMVLCTYICCNWRTFS